MPFQPGTGDLLLRAAQGLTQTLQLQAQLVQRQKEREETHRQEMENLRAESESRSLKLELDKLKLEREQVGLRETKAKATQAEAFASMIERHGLEEATRLIEAAKSEGRGGRTGAGIAFSDRVAAAVSSGAQRAFFEDLKGRGALSNDFASKVGLEQEEDGSTTLVTRVGDDPRMRRINVDQHLARLGISNPADLGSLGETRSALQDQIADLRNPQRTIGLTPAQVQTRISGLSEQVAVTEAVMEWSLLNQLNRGQEELLRLSGDEEVLNLKLAARDEPGLNRQVVIRDMPISMSNQAKDQFFTQIIDTTPSAQSIAAAVRQHYPKTPDGALDFEAPESVALFQTIQEIHGEQIMRELAKLLLE